MAPTTLLGQVTTTTLEGRESTNAGYPSHVAELLAGLKGVAYVARCALTTPAQYNQARKAIMAAFRKQMEGIGYGLVEVLTACPPNLKMSPQKALEWIKYDMIEEYPLGVLKDVDRLE